MADKLRVAVFGATGYTGNELARLLAFHPEVELTAVVSRARAGQKLSDVVWQTRATRAGEILFSPPQSDWARGIDAAFFAAPHGVAMREAPPLLDRGLVVFDLSADFRLRDAAVFARHYEAHAAPHLLPRAVYGLVEANRAQIAKAQLVACPGCYATAIELGLLPLIEKGLLRAGAVIIADAKSGVTGAGKRPDEGLLYAEIAEDFRAYAVAGHRHHPEIVQTLRDFGGGNFSLIFTPHLLPAARGIYADIYAPLADATTDDLHAVFAARYENEKFVEVLPADATPRLAHTRRCNRAQIGVVRAFGEAATAHIVVALDNLQKGAAGQATQAMNARFGFAEDAGLAGGRF